ncbi:MAG: radical SAM family heme chaperone HemW [Thermodesulfovibrionales bacterium]|nr:radical SAM family heme chaperone HemW [Thermodesulfovibrionales bacterium]
MSYGIYIHIPFCLKRCYYCDFFSSIYDESLLESYLNALKKEIASKTFNKEDVISIYFGGGTPSLLKVRHLADIISVIAKHHKLTQNCEITLEANPFNLTISRLKGFRDAGINRISLGIQGVFDEDLTAIGRLHNSQSGINAIRDAKDCGFKNISVDLLYGLPHQNTEKWLKTLETIINEHPHHISTYELTIHKQTPIYKMICNGDIRLPDDETVSEMYLKGCEFIESQGFRQYEISNFSHKGYECRHNLNYWFRLKYFGFGAGAHSFDGQKRYSNIEDITRYVFLINNGMAAIDNCTILNPADIHRENIFLSLRTTEGMDVSSLNCGDEVLKELVHEDLITVDDGRVRLTRKGMLVSNEVILRVW